MIIDVTGVTSGSSPYLVYLCDWNLSSCFFITGVTSIPPTIQIDSNYYFPGLQLLKVKIFDNDGCFEIIDALCVPTPPPNPTPPPTPLPVCACVDVCTYWQINLGAGPCIFKLFNCNGNIVNLRYFGTAGTYYVESVLQPLPFNQNCGYTIIDLGPCPTPLPTPNPTPNPTPIPTQIPGCVEYALSNFSTNNNITFNYTPCCFTDMYPIISPITMPPISNVKVCSTTIPTFPNTQTGGAVTVVYSCPCPTAIPPQPTPVPNIVWEMIPCCKTPWDFPPYPGGSYPKPYMSLLDNSVSGTMVIGTDNHCYTIDKPAVTSLPNVYWDGNPPTNEDCNECMPTHPCPPCYLLNITNTHNRDLIIWFVKCCNSITYPFQPAGKLNPGLSVSIITYVIPPVIYEITPGDTTSYIITNLGVYNGCP
jgi:hypothetical protein